MPVQRLDPAVHVLGGPAGHAGPDRGAAAHGHFSKSCDLHHHGSRRREAALDRRRHPQQPRPHRSGARPLRSPAPRAVTVWRGRGRARSPPRPPRPSPRGPPDRRRLRRADSALLDENSAAVFGLEGTVSYWVKPAFAPEMTGQAADLLLRGPAVQAVPAPHDRPADARAVVFASHDAWPTPPLQRELAADLFRAAPMSPCRWPPATRPRGVRRRLAG